MHGQASEANLALSASAMQEICRTLDASPPEGIYNMDETGLLYRCLPSRLYMPRRDWWHARGAMAMRHMDCVTLVLGTKATGTHKLPVSMIGEKERPMCFRGAGKDCPLPCFNQKNTRMDRHVHARWWNTVFLWAVEERHRGAKCALFMENASTQNVSLRADEVEILFCRPNVWTTYQPMDARFIAALNTRYKRRLLGVLVAWFRLPSRLQPPPIHPRPLTTSAAASPQPPRTPPGASSLACATPPPRRLPPAAETTPKSLPAPVTSAATSGMSGTPPYPPHTAPAAPAVPAAPSSPSGFLT